MKPLAISIAVIFISLFALSAVVLRTEFREEILYNFERRITNVIQTNSSVDLIYNSYYLAGICGNSVFLGNFQAPLTLTEYSDDLKPVRTIRLQIPSHERLFQQFTNVKVFDSTVFLFDGKSPRIYSGPLQKDDAECTLQRLPYDSLYFFNAIPVSRQSVLLQAVSNPPQQNILCKESATSYLIADNILTKQIDGLFCTSGTLQVDRSLNLAVYVYSHRNEYIIMDTSLSVIGRGNTIDTFSIARVRTIDIKSAHQKKLIAPESQVNSFTFVSEGLLTIESKLYTIYDDVDIARHTSVFDVYDLQTRTYCYSYYLPRHYNKTFSSLCARGNSLFAVYDHYLKRIDLMAHQQ